MTVVHKFAQVIMCAATVFGAAVLFWSHQEKAALLSWSTRGATVKTPVPSHSFYEKPLWQYGAADNNNADANRFAEHWQEDSSYDGSTAKDLAPVDSPVEDQRWALDLAHFKPFDVPVAELAVPDQSA